MFCHVFTFEFEHSNQTISQYIFIDRYIRQFTEN